MRCAAAAAAARFNYLDASYDNGTTSAAARTAVLARSACIATAAAICLATATVWPCGACGNLPSGCNRTSYCLPSENVKTRIDYRTSSTDPSERSISS